MSIAVKINAGIITIQTITIRVHKNAVKNTVILFPSTYYGNLTCFPGCSWIQG